MRSARLLIALALFSAACDSRSAPGASDQLQVSRPGPQAPPFAREDVLLRVAHQGLRALEFHPAGGPGLSFRERVTTDGHGRFAIEPVDALHSSVLDWSSFELLQHAAEGFIFRYRDFAIRDQALNERNWTWTDLHQTVTVAGRTCQRFRVQRSGEDPEAGYEVSLDPETGLVLAYEQRDEHGATVAAMVYESLDLEPRLDQVVWHEPANQERPLDRSRGLEEQLGARALQPRLLPAGYELREAATVEDGSGKRWLKLTYVDGVEPLFFLQELEGQGSPAEPEQRLRASAPPGDEASRVVVFQAGAATVVQGTVAGFRLIAIGKVGETELLDLLESSLP
jgi:hypothetical protein